MSRPKIWLGSWTIGKVHRPEVSASFLPAALSVLLMSSPDNFPAIAPSSAVLLQLVPSAAWAKLDASRVLRVVASPERNLRALSLRLLASPSSAVPASDEEVIADGDAAVARDAACQLVDRAGGFGELGDRLDHAGIERLALALGVEFGEIQRRDAHADVAQHRKRT